MKKEADIVVGIDCGLDKHQYQISTKEGTVLSKGVLENTKKKAKALIKKLESIAPKDKILVGMEATNTYHICMQNYFTGNGYKTIVINPLKTSIYKQIDDYGNKTDAIDANGICQFLMDGKHKNIKQMNQKYLKLRELCRCRQKIQGDMTRAAIRLQSRLVIINPEFRQYFSKNLCESAVYLLEKYATPEELAAVDVEQLQEDLDKIANGLGKKNSAEKIVALAKETFGIMEDRDGYLRYIQHHLEVYKFLRKKVRDIKAEIRKEAKEDYCKKEIETINSIPGIGIETSAGILSELGDIKNFEKISSIVRFAGMIALKKESSTIVGKSRMSKQGSRYLRCYLHHAAMGAKLHSATFAAVYANRNLKVKDMDPSIKKIAKAKLRSCLARRILETIAMCLMKDRSFDDKIAFESIELDDFVRETIGVQFQRQLAAL